MTDRVQVRAHAKVNLFLRILSREESGYHGLETALALLELADDITITRTGGGIGIDVTGADTGPPEQNLAYRAAQLTLEATAQPFGVQIDLQKHIPVRAGLGGGSSDAAATLHAVNALAGSPVPRHELLQLASRLGADVPFFAAGSPLAVAWNHGERLLRITPPPAAPVLVVAPDVSVSTPEAYAWYDAATPTMNPRGTVLLDHEAFETWGSIGRLGGNDFESVVFHRHPELRAVFERLAATHPLLVRMSGSGSAMFAVYRSPGACQDAENMMRGGGHQLIATGTRATVAAAPVAV